MSSNRSNKKISSFSHDDRKHIVKQIENLKNNEDYLAIFEILTDDTSNSYTQNSNGIFLNLSSTSDKTLKKVKTYIKKINLEKKNNPEADTDFHLIDQPTSNDRAYKLSNYEKNILKQMNIKKATEENSQKKTKSKKSRHPPCEN